MNRLCHYVLVPFMIRVMLGVVFILHGFQKVRSGAGSWGNSLDLSPTVQTLVAYGELIGGIALVIGILTRLAALVIAGIMGGAIYMVHLEKGFYLKDGGFEYALVLMVLALAVMLTGSGALGFDHWFRFRRSEKKS